MPLKIILQDNHLPACQKPFVVRSILSDTMDFDSFVDIMASGRTTLSKIDILAAMQLYSEELGKQLAEGKSVKTPIGLFYLSAAGSMDTPDDSFLPSDQGTSHELRLHFRAETNFVTAIAESVHLIRSDTMDQAAPRIRATLSSDSSALNATRAGDILNVYGSCLKFDRAHYKNVHPGWHGTIRRRAGPASRHISPNAPTS